MPVRLRNATWIMEADKYRPTARDQGFWRLVVTTYGEAIVIKDRGYRSTSPMIESLSLYIYRLQQTN